MWKRTRAFLIHLFKNYLAFLLLLLFCTLTAYLLRFNIDAPFLSKWRNFSIPGLSPPTSLLNYYPPFFSLGLLTLLIGSLSLLALGSSKSLAPPDVPKKEFKPEKWFWFSLILTMLFSIFAILTEYFNPRQTLLIYLSSLLLCLFLYVFSEGKWWITVARKILRDPNFLGFVILFFAGCALYGSTLRTSVYALWGDEGEHFEVARQLLERDRESPWFWSLGAFLEHPLLASYYIMAFLEILGRSVWSWRMSAVVASLISLFPLVAFLYLSSGIKAAWIGAIVFVSAYYNYQFSHIGYNNNLLIPGILFPLACAYASTIFHLRSLAFLAGVFAGVSIALNYLSIPVAPLIVCLFLFSYSKQTPKLAPFRVRMTLLIHFLLAFAVSSFPMFLHYDIHLPKLLGEHLGAHLSANDENFIGSFLLLFEKMLSPNSDGLRCFTLSMFAPFFFRGGSHFVIGNLYDPLSAVLAFIGLITAFVRILRGDLSPYLWILLLYAGYAIATGALGPYSYPALTRLVYLTPIVAILAGIGAKSVLSILNKYQSMIFILLISGSVVGLNFQMVHQFKIGARKHYRDDLSHVLALIEKDKAPVLLLTNRHAYNRMNFVRIHYRIKPSFFFTESNKRSRKQLLRITKRHRVRSLLIDATAEKPAEIYDDFLQKLHHCKGKEILWGDRSIAMYEIQVNRPCATRLRQLESQRIVRNRHARSS